MKDSVLCENPCEAAEITDSRSGTLAHSFVPLLRVPKSARLTGSVSNLGQRRRIHFESGSKKDVANLRRQK